MTTQPPGRREQNRRDKLDRIVAAATELFAERGVDEVTTQLVAARAGIGTGTLFLYVHTKGELLLLVQNTHYAAALEQGRSDALAVAPDRLLDAVMAQLAPVVTLNLSRRDHGRAYLREILFGDPALAEHARAHEIAARGEEMVADLFLRSGLADARDAATRSQVAWAVMYVAMSSLNTTTSERTVLTALRRRLEPLTSAGTPLRPPH